MKWLFYIASFWGSLMHRKSNWNNLLDQIDKCKRETLSLDVIVSQLLPALEAFGMLVKIYISIHAHTHTHTHNDPGATTSNPNEWWHQRPWGRPEVYMC